MKIKKANENDIKTIVDISLKDGYGHPLEPDSIRDYMKKGDIYWISEIKSKPVGLFKIGINKNGNAELFVISVILDYQRKGIGSSMLKKAEDLAKEWGKKEVFLYMRQENEKGLNFYKKQGYIIIKEAKDVYEKGDYYLLRKSL